RLVGERMRKVFGLGDELVVRVVRVDLDNRKIDFELESANAVRRPKSAVKPKVAKRGSKSAAAASAKKPAVAPTKTEAKKVTAKEVTAKKTTAQKTSAKKAEDKKAGAKKAAPMKAEEKPVS